MNASTLAVLATKYSTVASATLLVWGIALSLDQEIANIWREKKNLGTTLFFLNRYVPPIGLALDLYAQFVHAPSEKLCRGYQLGILFLDIVSIAIVQLVLVMRTHAMYQNRALFIWLVAGCFCSMFFTIVTCTFMILRYQNYISGDVLGINTGCLAACTAPFCRPLFIIMWIPFILFETTIFLLTVWKFYELCWYLIADTRTHVQWSTNVLAVIVRDGILYYIVILSVAIANFLVWIMYPPATSIAVDLLKSLQVTICSRLLLNLRTRRIHEENDQVPSRFSRFEAEFRPGNLIETGHNLTLPSTLISFRESDSESS